jgi:hypothetical protein
MPPRGYRDESKRLQRSIDYHQKALVRLTSGDERQYWKRQLAERSEEEALQKAAFGREPDLSHLVEMAILQGLDGMTAHAAAELIANRIGATDPRARHAIKKRLYGKFQKARALYRRLAVAPEDPSDAAEREIAEAQGITPRADAKRQQEALGKELEAKYWARERKKTLEWIHQELEQNELACALHASGIFKDTYEFARAYRALKLFK